MLVVTFLTFAVEIDLFREPLSVVVSRDLSDEGNVRNEQKERANERESEVAISYVPMVNDASHWVEEELVPHPAMRDTEESCLDMREN